MSHRVFVYGTLKEGFPNFAINRGRRIGQNFETVQPFPLYLVGERHSPWLVQCEGRGFRVTGQVFEIDDDALRAMDILERVDMPDGYRRLTLHVAETGGSEESGRTAIPVHAYLKPADLLRDACIMLGPLTEYEPTHAALYRPRARPDV